MSIPLTPVRFLYRAMELFGNYTAVISGEQEFTYTEFGDRCERLARALSASGIGPGENVAFLSFNNHQLLEGYYGVPLARAVLMPLNVRLSPPELTAILNHSGARILFYEPDFAPLIEVFRKECPAIKTYVTLNEEYERLIATGTPGRIDFDDLDEHSTAELFYTSGSTGTPKGVMLSHRALYLHALSVSTCYVEPETMVDLHTIPLFHANGWGHAHTDVMLGIKQVMVRRFEPVSVLRLIEKHRATDMSVVPTMANALLSVPDLSSYDFSSMREIQIGGAASSPELIARMERAFGCEVWAGYGLTETAPVLCISRPDRRMRFDNDEDRYKLQAMTGRPIAGVELKVVDVEGRQVARDGNAIGEIVVQCDFLMSGYYRDPEGTAAVMQDGWFRTGDMAVQDENGYVQIVDRRKEIIVSGGENISSIEVERAITAHPEVYECAVVPAPDEKWGEVPAAIVVRRPGSDLRQDQLLAFLETRLGKFKMPRIVEFEADPLPKTGTGKIRKLTLRERYWADRKRRVGE
jgi:fatty-acyl-CoA synthase